MKTRLLIPSVLAATVLIAGVFALMPVQEASTVHTQLGTLQTLTKTDTNFDQAETIDFTCTAAFLLEAMSWDVSGGFQGTDVIDLQLDPDGTGGDELFEILADVQGGPVDGSITGRAAVGALGGEANGFVRLVFTTETADAGNEDISVHYVFRTGGTCS